MSVVERIPPFGFEIRIVDPAELANAAKAYLKKSGRRFGHLTCRSLPSNELFVETLLLDTKSAGGVILCAPLGVDRREYPSLTALMPAAHWAERAAGDMFGVRAIGHPRWKSLILHSKVWPLDITPLTANPPTDPAPRAPYEFLKVKGEGIHEIPVGPIHAGIIEPGHFRFSCAGEIITNLEIRLGYQHRGIEKRITEMPWKHARFAAECASSDTSAANGLAHAIAMESILSITPPARAVALRAIALELERLANHVGDIGALSGDIGYSVGASLFPPMRGMALALAQTLTGNRRQRWYVRPGGVSRDLDDARRKSLEQGLAELKRRVLANIPLVLDNPAVIDRMEGTGRLSPALAKDFGVVGPAGRASGVAYDARYAFTRDLYSALPPKPPVNDTGDVLARAQIKAEEIDTSFAIVEALLSELPDTPYQISTPETLSSSRVGVGIVEAWRGELIHWVTTDENGVISRYAIKDPSFNNWTGLAIAVRGNLVADFPLCNKSFNLSYSGNDL